MAKQSNFSVAELAKKFKVSPQSLEKQFRARYGTDVKTWLHSLRMAEAYELLLKLNSVTAAARELDFKNPSTFSRHFKRFHGISPHWLVFRHRKP